MWSEVSKEIYIKIFVSRLPGVNVFFHVFVGGPVVFVQFIVIIVLTHAACLCVFVFYYFLDFVRQTQSLIE